MAKLERVYTIPLRKEAVKCQRYKRTPKAMRVLKAFVAKHMKTEDVRVGPALNQEIWARGMKRPPGKVKVNCVRDAEGVCRVELFGKPMFGVEEKKDKKAAPAKKDAPAKEAPKAEDKPKVQKVETKKADAEAKPEKKPEAKPAEKKE